MSPYDLVWFDCELPTHEQCRNRRMLVWYETNNNHWIVEVMYYTQIYNNKMVVDLVDRDGYNIDSKSIRWWTYF
jgi:hypothetical protein